MKKKLYLAYLIISVVIFLIELILYFRFNSTVFGLLYMILSLIFLSILTLGVINYSELNLKVRLSKNAILLILLIISMLLTVFKYSDQSSAFVNNMKVLIYIFKPIEIVLLLGLSLYDYKVKGSII